MRHIRRATLYYSVIQALYWAIYCLMVGFASAFLLDRGFTNSEIGLILGLSYLLSAFLQPVVGALFTRKGIPLNLGIAAFYAPVALLALVMRFVPLGHLPLAVMAVTVFTLQSMLQPSVNALSASLETPAEKVNFSLARGIGSAAYALSSFLMGRLLLTFAAGVLPLSYGIASAALIACLLFAPVNRGEGVRLTLRTDDTSYRDILRRHPRMGFFLIGACLMFLTYSFIDNFLLQILLSIGGDSADLGTAITLSAMTELPAMALFARLCRKGKGLRVFRIAVWFWVAKDVLTLVAPTPAVLYAVQLLNFFSCALYVPGMMEYMRTTLPAPLLLRGATMAGTATTLGSLIAALAGGSLIDAVGMRTALAAAQAPALLGAVFLTIALTASAARRGGAPAQDAPSGD